MKRIIIIAIAFLALYSCEKDEIIIDKKKENNLYLNLDSKAARFSRAAPIKKATVRGRYYWSLLFSIDNSTNTASQTFRSKYTVTKKFESKKFLRDKFSISSGFKFENKTSVGVKLLKETVTGSNASTFSSHLEMAKEVERTSETFSSLLETSEREETFVIGPGGKLDMYRLIYVSDAGIYETSTLSTSPKPDVFVELEFSYTENLLGVENVLDVLGRTVPRTENRLEWDMIRSRIAQDINKDEATQLYNVIQTMSKIKPRKDNRLEWDLIRKTCSEILAEWNTDGKNGLFRKFLFRLTTITPGRSNSIEWAEIRKAAEIVYYNTRFID